MKHVFAARGWRAVLSVLALSALFCCAKSKQIEVAPATPIEVDGDRAVEHLSKAIQFKTISHQDPSLVDEAAFLALHQYLKDSFPLVHKSLEREVVNDFSLIYTWKGTDPSLAPIIFMAHMDVVPVVKGTEDGWTHGAFSGDISEGYIWGRGSLDDKVSMMGILEAAEALLLDGFEPRRDIIFTFGHDEEIGGANGQAKIVEKLIERGVRAEYVLDESGAITTGLAPGIDGPVALIGVAEKGYMSVYLVVEDEGGHSSTPPPHSAIGVLATAIHKLEKNPFPAKLEGPTMQMLAYLAPEMESPMDVVLSNPKLFAPLIKKELTKSRSTNAGIRTTTAVTIIEAGEKENVLPPEARAVVNFRLMPGTAGQDVIGHIERVVDDPRVRIEPTSHDVHEASSVSDVNSESYKLLDRAIREIFPGTMVAPYLVLGGTDAKHYEPISDNIFRFLPTRLDPEEMKGIHGTNERVKVDNYVEVIQFYARMMVISN